MDRRNALGLGLAVGAYVSWGLLAPVGKILLETFPAMSLNAVRMVIACYLLFLFIPREAFHEGLHYLRRREIVVLALIGGGIDFTFYLYAIKHLDATFAVLGFYTAPLWTAVLAWFFLKERIGWLFIPTVLGLLGGSYLALFGLDRIPFDGFTPHGMTLAVLAGLGWAVYTVGLRKYAPDLRLRPLLVASFIVATVYFVLAALVVDGIPPLGAQPPAQWGWMLLHAVVPTTLALFLFNGALQRSQAGHVNVLIGVELIATVFFSWWLLGDTFVPVQFLGLALVLLSVSAYLWSRGRRPRRVAAAPTPT